jgi:hypothetical protein
MVYIIKAYLHNRVTFRSASFMGPLIFCSLIGKFGFSVLMRKTKANAIYQALQYNKHLFL